MFQSPLAEADKTNSATVKFKTHIFSEENSSKAPKEEETNDNNQNSNSPRSSHIKSLTKELEALKNDDDFKKFGIVNLSCDVNSHKSKITSSDDIEILVTWLKQFKARILNLSGNYLSEVSPVLSSIGSSDLPYGNITAIASRGLGQSYHNAEFLAEGIKNNINLLEIDMHGTGLVAKESLIILQELQTCKNLRHIDWSHNNLDSDCCKVLASLITKNNSSIRSLKIAHCQLTSKNVTQLLESLKSTHKLRAINLLSYELNESQAKTLLYILQTQTSLVSVDIDYGKVTQETVSAIKNQIVVNKADEDIKLKQLLAHEKLYEHAITAIDEDHPAWMQILLGTGTLEKEKSKIIQMELANLEYQKAFIEFEINFLEAKLKILKDERIDIENYLDQAKKNFTTILTNVINNQVYLISDKAESYYGDEFINPKSPQQRQRVLKKLEIAIKLRFDIETEIDMEVFEIIISAEENFPRQIPDNTFIIIKQKDVFKICWQQNGQRIRPVTIMLNEERKLFQRLKNNQSITIPKKDNQKLYAKVVSLCQAVRFRISEVTDKIQLLNSLHAQQKEIEDELAVISNKSTEYQMQLKLYELNALKRYESLREMRDSLPSDYKDNFEEIALLLGPQSEGLDPNKISIKQDTLLLLAIKKNSSEIVKLLLDAGADPFVENGDSRTTFWHILTKKSKNAAEKLLLKHVTHVSENLSDTLFDTSFLPESLKIKLVELKQIINDYLGVIISRQNWSILSLLLMGVIFNIDERIESVNRYYHFIYRIAKDLHNITTLTGNIKLMQAEADSASYGLLGRSQLHDAIIKAIDNIHKCLETDGAEIRARSEEFKSLITSQRRYYDNKLSENEVEERFQEINKELEKQRESTKIMQQDKERSEEQMQKKN